MAQLTTVERLEQAIGGQLPDENIPVAEYYIDLVSAYVVSYTGQDFSPETVTLRLQADYYGCLELPGGEVSDVHSVKMWGSNREHYRWQWNGLSEIYDLLPNEVVDVTFTRGYQEVPKDIQMVTTEAVKKLYESPSGQETGPLTRYRVGDVEEAYRAVDVGSLGGLFSDLEQMILNGYRTTATTLRVGSSQRNNQQYLPPDIMQDES